MQSHMKCWDKLCNSLFWKAYSLLLYVSLYALTERGWKYCTAWDLQTIYQGEQSLAQREPSFWLARTAYKKRSAVCTLLSLYTKNSLNCKEKEITIRTVFAVSISIYGIIFHTHNYFYILCIWHNLCSVKFSPVWKANKKIVSYHYCHPSFI